jgi:hypothetical protein
MAMASGRKGFSGRSVKSRLRPWIVPPDAVAAAGAAGAPVPPAARKVLRGGAAAGRAGPGSTSRDLAERAHLADQFLLERVGGAQLARGSGLGDVIGGAKLHRP